MAEAAENLPKIHERTYPGDQNLPSRSGMRLVLGQRNLIAQTAVGVFIVGSDNVVGEKSQNISIVQSSGCVVAGGLQNVSVFNSSGITVVDSNIRYENNIPYPSSAGSAFLNTSGTVTLLGTDPSMVFYHTANPGGVAEITLPNAIQDSGVLMAGRQMIIKNASSATATLYPPSDQLLDNAVSKSMATLTSFIVFSNGSNWWILANY